jgi:hypothetical protein
VLFFFVYVLILAGGQGHYYYQIPLVLPACLLIGRSMAFLRSEEVRSLIRRAMQPSHVRALGALLAVSYLALYVIYFSDAYSLSSRIPYHEEAGRVVREQTATDALVLVADFQEGLPTDFLYFADRHGWYLSLQGSPDEIMAEIEQGIAKGASVLAVVASGTHHLDEFYFKGDLFWRLRARFPTLAKADNYHLFSLNAPWR